MDAPTTRRWLRDATTVSAERPVALAAVGDRTYYLFRERWFTDDEGLDPDDVHALLLVREEQAAGRLRRARTHRERLDDAARGQAGPAGPSARLGVDDAALPRRGVVPPDVRAVVWARDGGRCTSCGATTELQFDHVIPVSLGGSSTEANVQLLCGPCNRAKGASVDR